MSPAASEWSSSCHWKGKPSARRRPRRGCARRGGVPRVWPVGIEIDRDRRRPDAPLGLRAPEDAPPSPDHHALVARRDRSCAGPATGEPASPRCPDPTGRSPDRRRSHRAAARLAGWRGGGSECQTPLPSSSPPRRRRRTNDHTGLLIASILSRCCPNWSGHAANMRPCPTYAYVATARLSIVPTSVSASTGVTPNRAPPDSARTGRGPAGGAGRQVERHCGHGWSATSRCSGTPSRRTWSSPPGTAGYGISAVMPASARSQCPAGSPTASAQSDTRTRSTATTFGSPHWRSP